MSDRTAYLTALIGRPWSPAQSCWHLVREVQRDLFSRDLPEVEVPADPSWQWIVDAFVGHPEEYSRWRLIPETSGIITAADGALVLMSRARRAAHIGVWLRSPAGVIHADPVAGVVLDSPVALRARGWARLHFYEPA